MTVNTSLSNGTIPTRERILADVKEIVAEFASLRPEEIQESHDLIADLGFDSLDVIEATMEIEEQFDISVPDDQAENIHTVGDIVDGVLRLL